MTGRQVGSEALQVGGTSGSTAIGHIDGQEISWERNQQIAMDLSEMHSVVLQGSSREGVINQIAPVLICIRFSEVYQNGLPVRHHFFI